jgi:hypothetical protein
MAARISNDGLWRVAYGELPGLTREELIARQPMKFEAFLSGHPKPDSGAWKLANISPYKIHQRLAEKMRVGRILLAADAAHCKSSILPLQIHDTISVEMISLTASSLLQSMQPIRWPRPHRRPSRCRKPIRLPSRDLRRQSRRHHPR